MLIKLFPFLRWFPLRRDALRADLIAGITVAMILVPQSMAYATLAGLPVVYGLYASFLPVIVASMWGASRFLHTGPVALLSLMSAAAIEPLASRGSDEFIQLSLLLALMVGVLRLALGLFRMGVLINLASHPVILGFTNAAAMIIGLSLVNSFINVPMPRSDTFLLDLWQVVQQIPSAHWPTLVFGLGTLVALSLLRKHYPKLPGVLLVVVIGTIISAATGFEKVALVAPAQIENAAAREAFEQVVVNEAALRKVKDAQKVVSEKLKNVDMADRHSYTLKAEAMRLLGEEASLKQNLYTEQVTAYQFALVPVEQADGKLVYRTSESRSWFAPSWRWSGEKDGQFKLSGGGKVVGTIPSGLPGFIIPPLDFGVISGLFATAFIMAMIGFMEATSISRALAAKTREKLDPNQELIGQGLANIVGSFFQSYVVSGSFSRSAVAARVGARTSVYAIISAAGVLLVMLFFTEYLYHLPQPVLAAIVMSAVFSLIDVPSMLHAWRVRRADGMIGVVTFITTLVMAPQLADGVLVGVSLTILLFLAGTMSPRSEVMGRTSEGVLAGAASNDLAPISEDYVVLRFDASLVFINAAYFEQAVLKSLNEFPNARALLVIGNSINRIDATGEEKLRALNSDLRGAGVTLMLAGLKRPVREALVRAGLDQVIGAENIFASKDIALRVLDARFDAEKVGSHVS
ncbi:MAG TPA: SulP family inorganic anion transporter [Gammaproteobacteria bacterium]|nr:SulP family inorganic anion transporter [Gammaproteobacteria bacterium]